MKAPTAVRRRKALTPSPKTLIELGPERLAQLLYDAAKADTALMRTLNRELAAAGGDLGEEIDKQIARVRKATSWLDARKATALTRELTGVLDSIVRLGGDQPSAALPRLFDLIGLAQAVSPRRRDGELALGELFRAAVEQAGGLMARVEPVSARGGLAEQAYRVFRADDLEITAGLIKAVAAALDPAGLAALRLGIERDLKAIDPKRAGDTLAIYQTWNLTEALSEIADAQGDVDAYIAAQRLRNPRIRDEIGMVVRLLNAGRAQDALAALDAAKPDAAKRPGMADLRIAALDKLGRAEEAQTLRWTRFESDRSIEALRAYLKRLPDFEDVEREAEALDQVAADKNALVALAFLIAWPDQRRAAALARAKAASLDGDAYAILTPAADALAHKDPLAATLLYRQMIDFALSRARSARYGHVARHLTDCAGLAKTIIDWEGVATHDAYMRKLKAAHERKFSFWKRVKA